MQALLPIGMELLRFGICFHAYLTSQFLTRGWGKHQGYRCAYNRAYKKLSIIFILISLYDM